MRIKLQLVMCSDDGQEETITDLVTLQKDAQRIEHLGLTLREAKQLLNTLQKRLLQYQVDAFLDGSSTCPDCGTPLKAKGYHTRSFRTLFGTFKLSCPRLFHCRCTRRKTTSFRPLSALLPESAAPELLFMETKWASLVSYGLTVDALTDFLPLDVTLDVKTVRHDTLKIAERCEAELGEEQGSFIEGCPRDWGNLPIPNGPITVGIDGGYVRDWEAKKHNFEVIVGKSTLAFTREEDEEEEHPSSKRFGFVQTVDTKPKRRLYEVLKSQGFQLNQQITFLSDGGDEVRDLQLYMSPEAEHILDWFHLSMKLTVLDQYAKGLVHCDQALGEEIREKIERLKWSLWHGNLYKALYKIDDIESLIYNFEEAYPKFTQLLKAVEEFRTYIKNNGHLIPNYGERYRNGEAIATGFVESTVNQVVSKRFCKKQQMQWTKRGAHLLLQTRVKTLNGELGEVFKRWYPEMQVEELAEAA
jgi:hypothetical protein